MVVVLSGFRDLFFVSIIFLHLFFSQNFYYFKINICPNWISGIIKRSVPRRLKNIVINMLLKKPQNNLVLSFSPIK